MEKEALSATAEVTVKFNEVDPLGIVWHGHYVRYFEDGREAFGKKYGVGYMDFHDNGFVVPVVKMHLDYKRPLKYGDLFKVQATLVNSIAAKLIFDYKIFNPSGQVAATGQTTQVLLEKDSNLLCLVLPDFLVKWKEKWGLM